MYYYILTSKSDFRCNGPRFLVIQAMNIRPLHTRSDLEKYVIFMYTMATVRGKKRKTKEFFSLLFPEVSEALLILYYLHYSEKF